MTCNVKLDGLFAACDATGSGFVGPDDFAELCSGFGIGCKEAQSIFRDLDGDGDGRISFADFANGFREYLGPSAVASRRNSFLVTIEEENNGAVADDNNTDHKRRGSLKPFKDFVDSLGHDDQLQKLLQTSWEQLCDLHQQLQMGSSAPRLISRFEGALEALITDTLALYKENKSLEETFRRERESHSVHLKNLEEEMEVQVSKAEARAREESRRDLDLQREALQVKMESELMELQNQLHLFQKVDQWMQHEKQEGRKEEAKRRLEDAMQETRQLRLSLAETQTSVALLRSELSQMRTQYEDKCRELHKERETVVEYMHQNDHIHRQLQLLHEANKRLQDTNDSLLGSTDMRCSTSSVASNPFVSVNLDDGSQHSSVASESSQRRNNNQRSRSPSEAGRESQRGSPCAEHRNGSYRIQRLMDDLDSGHSTMRDPLEVLSNVSLHDEILDSEAEMRRKSSDYRLSENSSFPTTPNYLNSPVDDRCRRWSNSGPPGRTYKVVLAGDASVGKSCFIHRVCKGTFSSSLASTLGVDFQVKTLSVDGHNVVVQLWDTAGQERFRSITKTYFRRADGVLLLYDVTSENSYLNIRHWVQDIEASTEKPLPLVLCANKIDLVQNGRWRVPWEDGEKLARQQGASFFQTSSMTGNNVQEAIISLSREMMKHEDVEMQTSILKIDAAHIERKNSCCSSGKK